MGARKMNTYAYDDALEAVMDCSRQILRAHVNAARRMNHLAIQYRKNPYKDITGALQANSAKRDAQRHMATARLIKAGGV
jgi:hypothetical protein